MSDLLGVLGGMGPAATVDFLSKIISLTESPNDQGHLPVVAMIDPRIPDRSAAIRGEGPSPEPKLISLIKTLEGAGASAIVIPCNTSHYWYDVMSAATTVPILSMIVATVEGIRATVPVGASVGIMATEGTIGAQIYQKPLLAAGYVPQVLDIDRRTRFVEGGIRRVKAGDMAQGLTLLESALAEFIAEGCTHVILGCTEVSLAFAETLNRAKITLHDSNLILARKTLRHFGRTPKY
jgi:aspartate racemase